MPRLLGLDEDRFDCLDERPVHGLLVKPEDIEPVTDMIESAASTLAPAGKHIIEAFCPVFQLLHASLNDFPKPRAVSINMMLQIHRLTRKGIYVSRDLCLP